MISQIVGFSAALLLLFSLTIDVVSNNPDIFAQSESMSEQMDTETMGEGGGAVSISSITEWIGIFSIGVTLGLLAFKTNNVSNDETITRRKIVYSVAMLSLAAGAIHLLLVQEHSKESFWWGVIFSITGVAQIGFGIIIIFVKTPQIHTMLYYIGIIGNALLVVTFILVRLFTPPFSPEGAPINELEPNGVISLAIEIGIVILLICVIKLKREGVKKIVK